MWSKNQYLSYLQLKVICLNILVLHVSKCRKMLLLHFQIIAYCRVFHLPHSKTLFMNTSILKVSRAVTCDSLAIHNLRFRIIKIGLAIDQIMFSINRETYLIDQHFCSMVFCLYKVLTFILFLIHITFSRDPQQYRRIMNIYIIAQLRQPGT